MIISELIEHLENVLEENGDISVYMRPEHNDSLKELEEIAVYEDEDEGDHLILATNLFEERKLKVVK